MQTRRRTPNARLKTLTALRSGQQPAFRAAPVDEHQGAQPLFDPVFVNVAIDEFSDVFKSHEPPCARRAVGVYYCRSVLTSSAPARAVLCPAPQSFAPRVN